MICFIVQCDIMCEDLKMPDTPYAVAHFFLRKQEYVHCFAKKSSLLFPTGLGLPSLPRHVLQAENANQAGEAWTNEAGSCGGIGKGESEKVLEMKRNLIVNSKKENT